MFVVKSIRNATCIACDKEMECFEVVCEKQALSGMLCLQDFRKQVKIATVTPAQPAPKGGSPAR
jgi:hypothetical protein